MTVQTRHDPRRLTYDQALQELANAEVGVDEIRDRSAGFAEFVFYFQDVGGIAGQ